MPPNVPSPEECELEEVIWTRNLQDSKLSEAWKKEYNIHIQVRSVSLLSMLEIEVDVVLGAFAEPDSHQNRKTTRCR